MDGINAINVSYHYQNQSIMTKINLHVPKHEITCLIGPNGSGKSTLLKFLAGLLVPTSGYVTLDNNIIHHYTRKVLAKKLSYSPQQCRIPPSLTVREYVALGRFCHQSWFSKFNDHDYNAIEQAIDSADLKMLADKVVTTLSAGQQQRARIALMLAQQAEYLLLDEPMASLDLKQQRNLLELLMLLQKKHAKTIIIILHDLQQVIEVANKVVLLKNGCLLDSGPPREILHSDCLLKLFDYPFRVESLFLTSQIK